MAGETDLGVLLREMHPVLNPGRYVFATTPEIPADARPVVLVAERESATLVLEQTQADRLGLEYEYEAAWITLEVRSALDAIGLTAAVATALARSDISCNVVAGYHHDHLFVPYEQAQNAVQTLIELSRSAAENSRELH